MRAQRTEPPGSPAQGERLPAVERLRAVAIALCLALLGALASAHPDLPLVDGEVRLAPGEALVLPTAVHFHRLVGRVRGDGADASLRVRVVRGEHEPATLVAPPPEDVLVDEPVGRRLNRLIACCDGVVFQDVLIEVRNVGPAPVSASMRLSAVHDDFAVVSGRLEPFAATGPAAMFVGVALFGLVHARRARRGWRRSVRWPRRIARAGLGLGAVGIAALAVAGMRGYGGGPVEGLVASMADLPVPGGPFGSRAATVLAVALLTWLAAVAAWHLWASWAGPDERAGVVRIGAALAGITLASGAMMSLAYGLSWVPATLALILAAPVAARLLRPAEPGG